MGATILIVDDDAEQVARSRQALEKRAEYETLSAVGGQKAIEYFLLRAKPKPDLILLDLIMPEVSGIDVIRAVRKSDAHIPIILLCPQGHHRQVMEAMQAGANDCLQKPANIHYLTMTIEKHLQREMMRSELARLSRYQQSQFGFEDIIGESDAIQRCLNQAKEACTQSLPLAIEGQTATGKELFARVIHSQSLYSSGRFTSIACDKPGEWLNQLLLDHAAPFGTEGGSLFFRHIEALSLSEQEALIQYLLRQEQQAYSGIKPARAMVSSHAGLSALYRKGKLHEKLYYYFTAQTISLPALNDRGEDITLLANHYLRRFTATFPFSVWSIDAAAAELLKKHKWQGNIVELSHFIQRAAYYAHEPVVGAHIIGTLLKHPAMPLMPTGQIARPIHPPQQKSHYDLVNPLGDIKPFEEMEADIIRFAIAHYRGKMTQVARKLGIGRSTLYRKMQDYNLREGVREQEAA